MQKVVSCLFFCFRDRWCHNNDLAGSSGFKRIKLINIDWQPGIGDPTLVGWVTVVAYFLAAIICGMAAKVAQTRSNKRRSSYKIEARFWIANMVIMTFLGFNKQLDIQTLFTEIGRDLARTGGWYDERQTIQILFILGLSLLAVLAVFAMLWSIRKMTGTVRAAAIGLCFLGTFVVVRAASFHKVDQFLGEKLNGLRWNGTLELSGILLISAAAWQYKRTRSNRKR